MSDLERSLQIGMGVAFDSSTLNELNTILEAVKKIQQTVSKIDFNKVNKSISKLNDSAQKQAKSTQDTHKNNKQIVNDLQDMVKAEDKLIQTTRTQQGDLTKIQKTYETIDGTVKTITDTLNKENEIVKRSTTEKQKQVKAESSRLEIAKQLNKLSNPDNFDFTRQLNFLEAKKGEIVSIAAFNKNTIPGFQQVEQSTKTIKGLGEEWVKTTVSIRDSANKTQKVIGLYNTKTNDFYVENIKAVKGVQDLKRAVTSWSQAISTAFERMLQWAVAGTLIFGTLRLLKQGFSDLIDMETELANITKVLPEGQNVLPLEESAIQMSRDFGQSVIETEKAMQSWARQYKENDDIIKMTNASLLAATATDITFEASVRNLSAIMAEWGYETDKAAHVVDVLNTMSNEYRTTAQDLSDALAKTGSGARAVGLDFEYLTGIVTTGIQTLGISGEEMGTMWSRVMARMRGNEQSRKAFSDQGIDPNQNMGTMLNELMAKWELMTKAQKENFAITVAGTHHWSKFIGLLDNSETIIEATTDAYLSFGSAQKEVDIMLNTTKKQFEQTNVAIQKFFQTNKGVLSIAKWLANIIENTFIGLSKVNMVIVGIAGSLVILIPQIISFFKAFNAAKKVTEGLSLLAFTVTKLTNPIFLTIALVGTLITAFSVLGSKSKKIVSNIEQVDAGLQKLNEEREGFSNEIRNIDDLSKKYDAYSKALKDAQTYGKDTTKIQEKLTLVKNKLAEAIADGNEAREAELKQMPDLKNASQERMKLVLAEINAQRMLGQQIIDNERKRLQAEETRILIDKARTREIINTPPTMLMGLPGKEVATYDIGTQLKINNAKTALDNLNAQEDAINEALALLKQREKKLPELLTLEDILNPLGILDPDLDGSGNGDISLELSKLTEKQVMHLQKMIDARQKQISGLGLGKYLKDEIKEYITAEGKRVTIFGDSAIISEQEGIINDYSKAMIELANDITKVVEANESLVKSLEKLNENSVEKITERLSDALFKLDIEGTPIANILGILDSYQKPYETALKETEQGIGSTNQSMQEINKQKQSLNELKDSLVKASNLMAYNIPLTVEEEKAIIDKLQESGFEVKNITKETLGTIFGYIENELKTLDTTYAQLLTNKSTLTQLQQGYTDLLEKYPVVNERLTDSMKPVGINYNYVKEAQDAYDNALEKAKNAGLQFEGTQQEEKLLENIKNAQGKYIESLQSVIDSLKPVVDDIPGLDKVIISLQEQINQTRLAMEKIDPNKFYNDWVNKVNGEKYQQYDSVATTLGYNSGIELMKELGVQTQRTSGDLKKMIQDLLLLSAVDSRYVELIKILKTELDVLIDKEERLAKIRRNYEAVTSVISHLTEKLNELGGSAAGIGTSIDFLFKNLKFKEGFEFNPEDMELDFSNLGESISTIIKTGLKGIDWQMLGVSAGITLANILIDAFLSIITAKSKAQSFDKMERDSYEMYDVLKGFNDFEENQAKLTKAYQRKGIDAIAGAGVGAGIGALIGSLIPVIGTGIGALIGGAIGGIIALFTSSANDEIKELEAELANNWKKLTEALGTSVGDVANSLQNAFQATNYFEFLSGWGQNLEDMTRQALIKAFLATPVYQQLYSNLSDVMTAAMLDSQITVQELEYIKQAGSAIAQQMKLLYPMLNIVDSIFPGSVNNGGSTNYTAGTSVPITYNVQVSVYSQAFMGDEDDAREFALLIGDYLGNEAGRG